MSLRIAFDCDGVVADLDSALAEIVTRLFGEAPPDEEPAAGRETAAVADNAAPAPAQLPPTAPADERVSYGPPAADAPAVDPSAAHPPAIDASAADGPTDEEVQAAPARFRALTRRQQHDLWEAVRNTENFWESLAGDRARHHRPTRPPRARARLGSDFHHAAPVKAATPRNSRRNAGWSRTASRCPASTSSRARAGRSPRRSLSYRRRRPARELPRREARVARPRHSRRERRPCEPPAEREAARHRAGDEPRRLPRPGAAEVPAPKRGFFGRIRQLIGA